MASSMLHYEIAVNGKVLSHVCVGDEDQFEAVVAKPIGDHDSSLCVTVFSTRARRPNKNISWSMDQLEIGDEITIRVREDKQQSEAFIKSTEDLESEAESTCFCSFCEKGDREVRSLIAGKDGVFICDECVSFCVEIGKPIRRLER